MLLKNLFKYKECLKSITENWGEKKSQFYHSLHAAVNKCKILSVSIMIALHMMWPTPDMREETWRFIKCGKWRHSKLPYAKSVAKTLERNAAAQILLPTYHSVEHSFAPHIYGITIMEHGASYGNIPKTQPISKILRHWKSYFFYLLLFWQHIWLLLF